MHARAPAACDEVQFEMVECVNVRFVI